MQITSNVTNPSFTAKLKNNTVTNLIVKNMNQKQLNKFQETLKALDEVHKDDVLEFKCNRSYSKEANDGRNYYVLENTKNKEQLYWFYVDKSLKLDKGIAEVSKSSHYDYMIKEFSKIANPNDKIHKYLFHGEDENTPKKDTTKKEVLNMLV